MCRRGLLCDAGRRRRLPGDSDTLTFTRDVDVLPEGHQLRNGDAFCLVGYQGSVSCATGEHGFTNYSVFGMTH